MTDRVERAYWLQRGDERFSDHAAPRRNSQEALVVNGQTCSDHQKTGEMSCFNQHDAVQSEYHFACTRNHAFTFVLSYDKMTFAVLEL